MRMGNGKGDGARSGGRMGSLTVKTRAPEPNLLLMLLLLHLLLRVLRVVLPFDWGEFFNFFFGFLPLHGLFFPCESNTQSTVTSCAIVERRGCFLKGWISKDFESVALMDVLLLKRGSKRKRD